MINRVVASVLFLILSFSAMAQGVVVDYNNPKKYKVGRVTVEGNNYFSDQQIIQQTGLMVGNEVTVTWWFCMSLSIPWKWNNAVICHDS